MFVELEPQGAGEEQSSCLWCCEIESSSLKGCSHDMHLVTVRTSGQIDAAGWKNTVTNSDILQQETRNILFLFVSTFGC